MSQKQEVKSEDQAQKAVHTMISLTQNLVNRNRKQICGYQELGMGQNRLKPRISKLLRMKEDSTQLPKFKLSV
jgi:hypothetical protein